MRKAGEHPQSLTDPRYPDGNTDTTLEWLPDGISTESIRGSAEPPTTYHYIRWKVNKRDAATAAAAAGSRP